MNICIPKERRFFEFRMGMTPAGVQMLCQQGHTCYIEHDAGLEAGFSNDAYLRAGGKIVYSAEEAFGRADLLLKIARPSVEEIAWLRSGVVIAGLLHISSAKDDEIRGLVDKGVSALALEQIQKPDGSFPVRQPLSQIGGRLSAQIGAQLLQNNVGGKGIILGGIAGVPQAEVVVIGAGTVGSFATRVLVGMGAHVTVLDTDIDAIQEIQDFNPGIATLASNPFNVAFACRRADLVIGAVYTVGDRAPVVVSREMVRAMRPRSVIMDISIDEGGCVETSHPTSHEASTFVEEGVVHYCVPNIPSIVARSSTVAFLNPAFHYILEIAASGIDHAVEKYPELHEGLRLSHGEPRKMWDAD